MKKFLITIFALMTCMLSANADSQSSIDIKQKDGQTVSFLFSEQPVITYDGPVMIVSTDAAQVSISFQDIENVTFTSSASSVESLMVSVSSAPLGIYDINGQLLKRFDEGESIDMSGMKQGVYVVKTKGSTYKILKK